MAYKDSDELKTDERYPLGDYSFRIERSSVPGSSNDKIEAICTKGGKNARKSIQVPSSTQIEGWYVEANETEATVYAEVNISEHGGDEKKSDLVPVAFPIAGSGIIENPSSQIRYVVTGGVSTGYFTSSSSGEIVCASDSPFTMVVDFTWGAYHSVTEYTNYGTYTHNNKTVYYNRHGAGAEIISPNAVGISQYGRDAIAWTMIYGDDAGEPEYKKETMLIGRFAIELEDAGGVGPGSDWTDPGDYDPDWEEGDPTHTLYVTVTGALSGRHNDPIVDPSYSYIPADKDTVKDYGCGGDGGHGGGGGAGASTVVVHKFATNQANSKEVTALARRHGYGSGGGKGGKGGDGCILVYY